MSSISLRAVGDCIDHRRLLSRFKKLGLVHVDKRAVELLEPARLKALAAGPMA